MIDIVRAFRLARGAKTYVEVGSRDKGNIAWLSHILDINAKIVDVDLEHIPDAQERLASYLPKTNCYNVVKGNSVGENTIEAVHKALGRELADVIFLDSSHMYSHFLRELSLYWRFLKSDGVLLVHDIFWEGNGTDRGKAQAAELIDRYVPVYVVAGNDPVSRFFYRSKFKDSWGGVGILLKADTSG
jgi:predicted O-methyltransferase YrrM